ncbi:MAG: RNA polymerase sigma factor, partial [Anaerolineales bacterium]
MPQQPFETIVEMHRDEIFAYLWRLIPGDQIEDCLQETFLRAFRTYERTAPDSTYRAWLYKIATNVARTAQSRWQREMTRELQNPVAPEQRTLLDSVIFSDDLKVVLQAVEALPHKQRAALMMRKYQDMDYRDIGAA